MSKIDNPLKHLETTFITDFVAWLLGAQVREATSRNVELP